MNSTANNSTYSPWEPSWPAEPTPEALQWLLEHPTLSYSLVDIAFVLGQESYKSWSEQSPKLIYPFNELEPYCLPLFGITTKETYHEAVIAFQNGFSVPRISIDSNVLIDGFSNIPEKQETYSFLTRSHQEYKISVALSSRLINDKLADEENDRRILHLGELEKFHVLSSVGRVEESYPDYDMPIGENGIQSLQALEALIGANRSSSRLNTLRDVDHLFAHFLANRDFFLTSDTMMTLNKKEALWNKFAIRTIEPEIFLEWVKRYLVDKPQKTLRNYLLSEWEHDQKENPQPVKRLPRSKGRNF